MRSFLIKKTLPFSALLVVAGCNALPNSGPAESAILEAEKDPRQNPLGFRIVPINTETMRRLAMARPEPISALDKDRASPESAEKIGPGDRLQISVFEMGAGLFSNSMSELPASLMGAGGTFNAGSSGGNTAATTHDLPPVEVNAWGNIRIPYVGKIHAAGKTPSELAAIIQARMSGRSQMPQILVRTANNLTNAVIVSGDIHKPGRFPLTLAQERLLDMIAMAGGATHSSQDSVVVLTRKGKMGRIPLRALESDPTQNIALMPGDRVQVIYLPRTYTVFGATKVSETPFAAPSLTLAEALARIGGPNDQRADPNAIFLFRYEDNNVARALGLKPHPGGTPVIYNLDMMNPTNYFLAQKFVMKDKDLIYVANASSNGLYKFINMIGMITSPGIAAAYLAK